jgi:hypothetical protein
VECHGDEARAVGAVSDSLRIGVSGAHRVWDVARDPVLSAGDDFAAADLAARGRAAAAAAFGWLAAFETGGTGAEVRYSCARALAGPATVSASAARRLGAAFDVVRCAWAGIGDVGSTVIGAGCCGYTYSWSPILARTCPV